MMGTREAMEDGMGGFKSNAVPTKRRRLEPEPVTILREEYNALLWVLDLAKQLIEARETSDRPNENEALALLPEAVQRARDADTDA